MCQSMESSEKRLAAVDLGQVSIQDALSDATEIVQGYIAESCKNKCKNKLRGCVLG